MGIYDDERSGIYDNSNNRNFYKTTDRRGNDYSKQSTPKEINETPKVDQKYSKETPFIDENKIEREIDEIIDRIDKKNYIEKVEKEHEEMNKQKDQLINELIYERDLLKSKKRTYIWFVLWAIVIGVFIIIPIIAIMVK